MDEPASRLLLFNDSPNSLLSTAFAGDLTVSAISVIGLATPIETLPATTSTKSALSVQVAGPGGIYKQDCNYALSESLQGIVDYSAR